MTAVLMLMLASAGLGAAAALELLGRPRRGGEHPAGAEEHVGGAARADVPLPGAIRLDLPSLDRLLGLRIRVARAGLEGRVSLAVLLASKLGCCAAGAAMGLLAAPAAPGRLSWVVAVGMPAAGFLAPDAWLERRARARLRALRAQLPDALDLVAVGVASGRSPLAGLAGLGEGGGPLASELSVLAAEASCGEPQRGVLESLRRRVPVPEVAAICGVIERSRRYGSPLAEQLTEQAGSLRAAQRRHTEEHAARAAPKIQLAVALLLVPSVLLMIAAGLLANMDRFMAGL